ncbi:MAG TPA: ABC transporter permease subunit [Lacunisphaera sp.]|nr:ABC transporter permease subunit [Lacunisphaera sp.]
MAECILVCKSAGASVRRMRLVAGQALGEALHLKLGWLLVAVGAALVLMARWLRDFNFGAMELKFLADFGLGAIGLLGTLLAALVTAQLFFNDLERGMPACVLTRPIRRWEYMGGKLAGVMAALALYVGALMFVLAVVIAVRERELGATYLSLRVILQMGALAWLKFTLVAAMTLLVCSYAGSALFASSAGLLLAIAGHLRSFTEASGQFALLRAWPNLAKFDAEPWLAGAGVGGGALLALIGYWALFLGLLAGLAAYVFEHREF